MSLILRVSLALYGAHFALTLNSKGSATLHFVPLLRPRAPLALYGALFAFTLNSKGSSTLHFVPLLRPRAPLALYGALFAFTLHSKASATCSSASRPAKLFTWLLRKKMSLLL